MLPASKCGKSTERRVVMGSWGEGDIAEAQ